MTTKKIFWLLLLLCVVTIMPFLGLYEYNTKGEPREAIVSYSMLATDNWTLPRNNGGEMAYKPPFFHWCVAAVSAIKGEVTEATSRIPSAIALIAVVMSTFVFFARRRDVKIGLATALITLLSMELHRAGGNCRVDMVLTALSVGAFYLFYRWYEKGCRWLPFWAIILMSFATFTKGPVGTIIPCCVIGLFLLLKKENFFRVFGKLFLCGLLSLIIPAFWYYAAYQQGGQEFVDLMYEENIGRMTNTMGYDSCVEPWWYNFLTLLYGLIPFTLVLLLGMFSLKGKSLRKLPSKLVSLDDVTLFSLSSAIFIIVFYCIPQSKRSVYLMPMYPFLAYFIAKFMFWLERNRKKSLNIYTSILAIAGILLFVTFLAVKFGLVPDSIFSGKHAPENILMLHNIAAINTWWQWIAILIPTVISLYWIVQKILPQSFTFLSSPCKGEVGRGSLGTTFYSLIIVVAVYLAVDAAYKPAALNAKSSKYVATELRQICTPPLKMYEYIEAGEKALGDPVHYFELNFYLGNVIERFTKCAEKEGYLLIGTEDMALHRKEFEANGYTFSTPIYTSPRRVAGQILEVYKFTSTRQEQAEEGRKIDETWVDTEGKEYPVYVTNSGKAYIIKVSDTTGKEEKEYLPAPIAQYLIAK